MWKDIIGFENLYKINEHGDVFSIRSQKIISPYITNKGYKMIDLNMNGKKYKFLVHRLVAMHFIPNPYNHPIVLHKDNVKLNTYYENLSWGTISENNAQAIRDGLNSIPRPDTRLYYEVYNNTVSFICKGAAEVNDIIGYGTDSAVRHLIDSQNPITHGPCCGFIVKRSKLKDAVRFF